MLGDCDELRRLLSAGADPNALGDKDTTPLQVAAVYAHPEAVEVLLTGGADPNRTDPHGNGPLWTAVHQACLARRTDRNLTIVRLLLASGADPDHKNRYGYSPRESAIQRDETVAALFAK
jgi:ankyrin repeat protein